MPIDQALKDKITEYTGKMSDAEIVNHLTTSQKYADVAAKIKQARDSGMSDSDILDQAMAAKVATTPTTAPTQTYLGGVKEAGGELVKKALPWMLDKQPAGAPVPAPAPAPVNEGQGAYPFGRPAKVGAPEPVLETPPEEWKQTAMKGVNVLPEAAQTVGTLAGAEAGPAGMVVGGALGRGTGAVLQSPLQKLLLPKSDTENLDVLGTAREMGAGAAGGAEMAMGARPGAAISEAAGLAKQPFGTLSRFLSRRTLRAPLTPEMPSVTTTIPREGLNVVGGKAPAQIATKVNEISRQVDKYIANASAQGKTINTNDILKPAEDLLNYYKQTGETGEYATKMSDYIQQVRDQFGDQIDPQKAQSVKKFIYDAINFDKKSGGQQLGQVGVQGKKAVARGLRGELEETAPEIGPLNTRIGKLLEAKPAATKAAEQYSMDPMRKRMGGRLKQWGARGASEVEQGLEGVQSEFAPEVASVESIGNPFANLEATLGLKYPKLSREVRAAETRPERLLPEETTANIPPIEVPPTRQIEGRSFGGAVERGEMTPRTRNRFGGEVPVPENLPERGFQPAQEMRMQDLINKIAEGRGHEITAEDKVEFADSLIKRIGIKIQSGTKKKENPLGFNFNERMKE